MPDGSVVTLYTLANKNGMSVSVMDYGATIVNIRVPDRQGRIGDVVLGFDTFEPYLTANAYFGATIGRFANRIAKGQFHIGATLYHVPVNNGVNSLHGGTRGFDKSMWHAERVDAGIPTIRFSRLSPDGEEGYPGNLKVSVTFSLDDDNKLRLAYEATTDKPTIINLTNHTYFNLAGGGSIWNEELHINARSFLPVDETQIPTGEIKAVADTPWDFDRTAHPIGDKLMLTGGRPVGYDHNYILRKGWFSDWNVAADLYDPTTGRTLSVFTDQPGLQFYSGNFLDGTLKGKGGQVYRQYDALTLETQHYPDSPNHADFPSTVLEPGDTYRTTTVYAFGVGPRHY